MGNDKNYSNFSLLFFLLKKKLITRSQISYAILLDAFSNEEILMQLLEKQLVQYTHLLENIAQYLNISVLYKNDFEKYTIEINKINMYLQNEYILIQENSNQKILVSRLDIDFILSVKNIYQNAKIYLIARDLLYRIIFDKQLSYQKLYARDILRFVHNNTSKDTQYKLIIFCIITFLLISYLFSFLLFIYLNAFVFICHNLFKCTVIFSGAIRKQDDTFLLKQINEYPKYSILVPLHKEKDVDSIVNAISCLKYPKYKLQVNLILETDDIVTTTAVQKLELPYYIHVIFVGKDSLKTKPNALNFAMPYVVGEYVVVYDAEDIPDPMQIIMAYNALKNLPLNYIGVQAKLRFYNYDYNLLTLCMSTEYLILFGLILFGMYNLSLPFPLGGTSNHFKTNILKEIGCWDAFNVTEDAELGMRISKYGYKMGMIDSYTSEEATYELGNWIKQRSRWIKGYWQTFFTCLRIQKHYKLKDLISIYSYIGFGTYNFVFQPIFLIIAIFSSAIWLKYISSAMLVLFIVISMLSSLYATIIFKKTKHNILKFLCLNLVYPLYFFLHFIASAIAIYELCRSPFSWYKTKHTPNDTLKKCKDNYPI